MKSNLYINIVFEKNSLSFQKSLAFHFFHFKRIIGNNVIYFIYKYNVNIINILLKWTTKMN
jgi:hypothetical protein